MNICSYDAICFVLYSDKLKKMNQASLWQRLKNGDSDSLKQIYEENIDALFAFGRNICRDEQLTLDYIHDLFIYIWENRQKLGDAVVIRAYLLKSLRNKIIDDFRKKGKLSNDEDVSLVGDSQMSREEEWVAFETELQINNQLSRALQQLTDRQREIIFLKYNQNLTYEEIGEILGIAYQSVRNLTHRAISELRRHMTMLTLVTLCIIHKICGL